MYWSKPIIPAAWEVEVGGSLFEASLGKISMRLYLKNKLNTKDRGLGLRSRMLT
jgi:hypothetical protein